MKNIINISNFTIREALSRKIIVTFFAISTFVLIIFALLFTFVPFEDLSGMVRSNGSDPINIATEIVKGLKLFVVAPLFGGGLFLSIFSASSFIPNMLEKGVVDLIVSKPISRTQIILGKFLGGVLIVLINIAYLIIILWILIGLKFNIWDIALLSSILTITFTFASLYALIILVGILTQSSILAMMLSYIIFFVLSPILTARDTISTFLNSSLMEWIMDILYYIIPKTSELGSLTTELAMGYGIDEYQPILSTFIFLVLVLYISIIIFSKKDY
ncbi:MAG: ABC transporter permease subunit [Ignavibacteriales bacterium]|nr:ABC transporter permease subunit [Ignavibacteriales bacterium]MCB9218000.1 ABC transporter permease subunit [Ignavibacteriales bacterium]